MADNKLYHGPMKPKADMVKSPAHYNMGKIEVWDFITDQQMGYFDGNAVKYICRYRHKGKPVEDLDKAIAFLTKLRDIEKAKPDPNKIIAPLQETIGKAYQALKPTPPAPRVVEKGAWNVREVPQPTPGIYGKEVFKPAYQQFMTDYDRS